VRASLLLLLTLAATGAPAQQLGTLFHSAAEREVLDRQRRGEPAAKAATPRPDPVITGYVKRSDGKSTVFLDGKPYAAREARAQELLEPRIVDRRDPPGPAPAPIPARTREGS
jgi:hypothetical protein